MRLGASTMKNIHSHSWRERFAGFALAVMVGCSSTQLQVDRNHPASPSAASAPLPAVGLALDPGFDAKHPEPSDDRSPAGAPANEHSSGHQHHGGAAAPPANSIDAREGGASNGHDQHRAKPTVPASDSDDAAPQWTCPMHPQILQAEPGKCPICGMKLQPVPPEGKGGTR